MSYGEKRISELLEENNINYAREVSFSDLKSDNGRVLRYDFAILGEDDKIVRLIEFDGPQHYDPADKWYSEEAVERDAMKDKYAKERGLDLIRVKYNMRDNITLELLGF